jgi:hypothetical protein
MKHRLILFLLFIVSTSAFAQSQPRLRIESTTASIRSAEFKAPFFQNEKPPASSGRIIGEILAGGAGGLALGYAGLRLAAANCSSNDLGDLIACSYFAVLTGAAGYWLGTAGGVYLVGNTGDQTGSFYAALFGTFSGALVGGVVGRVLLKDKPAGTVIFAAGPPIFAALVFNSGRRYKDSAGSGFGFINVREGRIAVAVPAVCFRPHPFDGRTLTQNVNLMSINF